MNNKKRKYNFFRNIIKKIYYKLRWYLPKETAHKLVYWQMFKRKLDLKNPQDINQWIHYLTIYKFGEKEAVLFDKYAVKKYLENLSIPDLHTAKLLGYYANVDEIDLSKLPDQFVLKITAGCGDIEFCKDKKTFDLPSVKQRLKKRMNRDKAKGICEYYSINVRPMIICEELLSPNEEEAIIDYKFFCINGQTNGCFVIKGRFKNAKRYYYDREWTLTDFILEQHKGYEDIPKPDNYDRMLEIAEILSAPFPFVRVDLYNIQGKIYFSEFTFAPSIQTIKQTELDRMGSMLRMEQFK
jgi:hypothetical protein